MSSAEMFALLGRGLQLKGNKYKEERKAFGGGAEARIPRH